MVLTHSMPVVRVTAPKTPTTIVTNMVSTAYDFGPWGGSLVVFDTVPNTSLEPGLHDCRAHGVVKSDLYSVMPCTKSAHIFGVGIADSWKNQESVRRVCRSKRRRGVRRPRSDAESGLLSLGSMRYNEHCLSRRCRHKRRQWIPTRYRQGTRKFFTNLDVAGMADMGWTVVPEPSSVIMLCSAALVLFARTSWRRRKQQP